MCARVVVHIWLYSIGSACLHAQGADFSLSSNLMQSHVPVYT